MKITLYRETNRFSDKSTVSEDELLHLLHPCTDGTVFLLAFEESYDDDEHNIYSTEIFITQRIEHLRYFAEQMISEATCTDVRFYLQEYSSYEDAYSVALSMREPSPLCYDQSHTLN